MLPLTPIVKYMIIINVVVFAVVVLPGELGYQTGLADALAMYYPSDDRFRTYQIVTHFFMHASLPHILFNMMGLYFLGPILEMRIGSSKFLGLYLLAALGSAALHTGQIWFTAGRYEELAAAFSAAPSLETFTNFFGRIRTESLIEGGQSLSKLVGEIENNLTFDKDLAGSLERGRYLMDSYVDYLKSTPVVGASGAISGVAAAFAVFFPWQKLQIIFIPIGIYAAYLIPFIFAVDLFLGVMDFGFDNIAHWAHLGGGITGALLAFVWRKTTAPPWLRRWDEGA